jgi:starch synthase
MRVLYVTSEVYPLAKTGGLADVSAALPAALKAFGVDARILMPAYRRAIARASRLRVAASLADQLGFGETRLLETTLPVSNIPAWLVDCPALFDRDGGLYQTDQAEEWPDNAQRFALLNHAAMAVAEGAVGGWIPDVVHANDWHAGLLPLLLSARGSARPATLFTIHNLAYQGLFGVEQFTRIGVPEDLFRVLEFYGRISFLKGGISGADALTTVSPTYATEILTPEYGCGLDGLLRERSDRLTGIMNGADYAVWDPRADPYLAASFSRRSMVGKSVCKHDLRRELGLDAQDDAPLIGFMSRLVYQKMPEIVCAALPRLIEDGMQFALAAEGDPEYQAQFRALAERYPGRVAIRFGYEEALGHRLIAGADMLAHPARFEPCGLVPIYALRYGTIPIVRRSGGMSDSVVEATPETIQRGRGTGFSFDDPSGSGFLSCAKSALAFYRQPLLWRKLQSNAMAQDFGWRRSARAYADIYASLAGVPISDAFPHEPVRWPAAAASAARRS